MSALQRRNRGIRLTCGAVLALVLAGLITAPGTAVTASGPTDANGTAGNVTVENVSILTAPRESLDELDSRQAVATARAEERLVPTNSVAVGDAIVVRFESDRFDEVLAARDGSTPTAQFRSLVGEPDTTLRFRHTNPGTHVRRKGLVVDPASVAATVADRENGTYYVVVDSTEVDVGTWKYQEGFAVRPEHDLEIDGGESWTTNVTVSGETLVSPAEETDLTAPAQFVTAEREFTDGVRFDWSRRLLVARPNQSIPVATTLAPGTVVTVDATTASGAHVGTKTVTVRPATETAPSEEHDAVVRVSFDLSGLDAQRVNLTMSSGSTDGSATFAVVDPPVLSLESGPGNGPVVVRNVTVPDGGFVAVYQGGGPGISASDRYLGSSEYLSPGTHDRVTVIVEDPDASGTVTAVLRYSDDGAIGSHRLDSPDTDPSYLVNGSVASDSLSPPTPTRSPTSTESSTTSTPTGTPPSDTTSVRTTDGAGPGLTVITALVGLLACRFLAPRPQ